LASITAGARRQLWQSIWTTPASCTAFSIVSASGTVLASGFSQKTTFFAAAAARAISAWLSPGVQMSTTSMSLRSTTCCHEVACSSHPSWEAAFSTPAALRPTTTFITGSLGVSKKRDT